MKMMIVAAMATLGLGIAGRSTAAPPPAAALAPPPTPGTADQTKVGAGSKAGFCTFKDAAGKLYEAKC